LMIPFSERHLQMMIRDWAIHYNRGRPHISGAFSCLQQVVYFSPISIGTFLALLLEAEPVGVLNPTEPELGMLLRSRHLN